MDIFSCIDLPIKEEAYIDILYFCQENNFDVEEYHDNHRNTVVSNKSIKQETLSIPIYSHVVITTGDQKSL